MAISPRHTPMPDHLANLREPTRVDAIEAWERGRFNYTGSYVPRTFEDYARARGRKHEIDNPTDQLREMWAKERSQGIDNAMLALQREYAENVASRDRIAATNAKAFEIEKQELRTIYLNQPGATEADFEQALPGLIEARRQQVVLNASAEWERQKAEFRAVSGI